METHIQLAILMLDGRMPKEAMSHLRCALAEANKRHDTAMRRVIFAEMNRLRRYV